jgi:hypothetical protein
VHVDAPDHADFCQMAEHFLKVCRNVHRSPATTVERRSTSNSAVIYRHR